MWYVDCLVGINVAHFQGQWHQNEKEQYVKQIDVRVGKMLSVDRSDGCRVIMVYKLTARARDVLGVFVCGSNVLNETRLPGFGLFRSTPVARWKIN